MKKSESTCRTRASRPNTQGGSRKRSHKRSQCIQIRQNLNFGWGFAVWGIYQTPLLFPTPNQPQPWRRSALPMRRSYLTTPS